MITLAEKEALLNYLEFLLIKDFMEPIVDKHVNDPLVVGQCYDKVYAIVNELEKELDNRIQDAHVDASDKTK